MSMADRPKKAEPTSADLVAVRKISEAAQGVAAGLDEGLAEIAGQRVGFALVVFTFPRATYVSNCKRDEIVRELEKLLGYWREGLPDIPAHKVT